MVKYCTILLVLFFTSCEKEELIDEVRKKIGKVDVVRTGTEKCGYSVTIETNK